MVGFLEQAGFDVVALEKQVINFKLFIKEYFQHDGTLLLKIGLLRLRHFLQESSRVVHGLIAQVN